MNKQILNQALITMGYRKMDENHWGKPVGFCLIIAEIDEQRNTVELKTMFNNVKNESMIWGSSIICLFVNDPSDYTDKELKELENKITEQELYETYVYRIGYGEYEAHVEEAMRPMSEKVFAFKVSTDVMYMI